ncbi:hypothetical protein [Fulvivirga sediminis]|uniref:Uncharacterized protein n=1 Tax=Fulvivirga sediminis TaxID=2803949 RepID=A0A937K151_9BACT|nr:hypothetical protein [Fulvivirga sediminis]MBL3656292.1 hypothetical protein [Fulvivirga sediminis]
MENLLSLLDKIDDFYRNYELEITWFIFIILFFKLVKNLSQDNFLNKHSVSNRKEKFLIDFGFSRPNRNDSISYFIAILLIFTDLAFSFYGHDYQKLFITLGSCLILMLNLLYLCTFYIEIKNDSIILDSIRFKAINIDKLEVWDNMITVHSEKKELDIKLTYKAKNFELVKLMILKLKEFCTEHQIAFDDLNFQYNLVQNEVARK